MMTKTCCSFLILIGLFLFVTFPGRADALDLTPVIREELDELPLAPLEDFLGRLDYDVQRLIPEWSPEDWAKNGIRFEFSRGLSGLLQIGIKEIILNLRLLIQILALAAVCAILQRMHSSWVDESVSGVAFGLTYLVMIGLAIGSFVKTLALAKDTLEAASSFILALLPTVFALMAAAGGLTTVSVMHPMLLAATSMIIQAVRDYMLPLSVMTGVLGLTGHLAEGFSLSRLAGLLRQIVIGGLGLIMTIFLGVVTVQGLTTAVADGVSIRTVKYLTGSFVPVVGGALADSMELAAGCSLLIKNALGTFGALAVLMICLVPMIKIFVISLTYRLASALVQPLGNERLSLALQEIANTFVLVFGALAVVGLMFFIALTILVGLGNLSVMLR